MYFIFSLSFQDPYGRYIVLYSYSAQDENDLSVERGQCVTVLNKVTELLISRVEELIQKQSGISCISLVHLHIIKFSFLSEGWQLSYAWFIKIFNV